MRLLRAADRAPLPWRNGAGLTWEIAVEAPGPAPGWRVSLAVIDRPAPFSRFDRQDRTLMLLEGGPLTLAGEGWNRRLVPGEALDFAGELSVEADIVSPARVLNVMSVRGRFGHQLRHAKAPLAIGADTIVVSLDDDHEVGAATLHRFDAVRGPARIEGTGELLSIRVTQNR